MNAKSYKNLKAIHFESELLPNWAQLLDLAARLCPLPEEVRHWFSLFTSHTGVDDSRTVIERCKVLRQSIEEHQESVLSELRRSLDNVQPTQIISAWFYALDTMIREAEGRKTCSWTVEGTDDGYHGDSDDGEITLRRV